MMSPLIVAPARTSWCTSCVQLSAYANGRSEEAKKRYKDKISMIGGLDPYLGSLGERADL